MNTLPATQIRTRNTLSKGYLAVENRSGLLKLYLPLQNNLQNNLPPPLALSQPKTSSADETVTLSPTVDPKR